MRRSDRTRSANFRKARVGHCDRPQRAYKEPFAVPQRAAGVHHAQASFCGVGEQAVHEARRCHERCQRNGKRSDEQNPFPHRAVLQRSETG